MKDAQLDVLPKPGLRIGDRRIIDCSGGEIDHIYPATGKPTVKVSLAGAKEVDEAVQTAKTAFPTWRAMPANERRNLMLKLSQLIAADTDAIREMSIVENGMTRLLASKVAGGVADTFAYYAGWSDKVGGDVIDVWSESAFDYAQQEPYGVVAAILPWNGPLNQLGLVAPPALAAGNCMVVKPSSLTPFTALRLVELALEAGFPPGVINTISTDSGGGELLCSHPGIDMIHLTGSVPTGKAVMATAAKNLTPVGFELGGKSATIIFDDADPQAAAQRAGSWLMGLSSQVCLKGSRVLVQSKLYDQIVSNCRAFAGMLSVGDPPLETTMVGPLVSASQRDEIMGFIERAKENVSGELVCGGERLGGDLVDGYFVAPTIFANVDNRSEIAQEEVFGPVITISPFDTEEEAVSLANDTRFGLACHIQTNDLRRAHRVVAAIDAGNVWIGPMAMPASMPFGGVKNSGFGRVGGIYGIREFTRTKNVHIS